MGGTKCLRLGTCELEYMGGVLQKNSSMRRRLPPGRMLHCKRRQLPLMARATRLRSQHTASLQQQAPAQCGRLCAVRAARSLCLRCEPARACLRVSRRASSHSRCCRRPRSRHARSGLPALTALSLLRALLVIYILRREPHGAASSRSRKTTQHGSLGFGAEHAGNRRFPRRARQELLE